MDQHLVGLYLVDMWCLGVKNCGVKLNVTEQKIKEHLARNFPEEELIPFDFEDARSLVLGALDYARKIDIKPHPEWDIAQYMFEPDRPYEDKFDFGDNGVPHYYQGPYDQNVDEIVEKVDQAGGHFTLVLGDFYDINL